MPHPRKYPANLYRRINGAEWILTQCTVCASDNYCEQHGTVAECHMCARKTEHVNVPYERRGGPTGLVVFTPAR
jgi:hypothetical protein